MRKIIFESALWLLNRFGISQQNEALMGDLVEEYAAGRSSFWLWRQTTNAIATNVKSDLRDHKLSALRAIATGWLLSWGWLLTLALLFRRTSWHPFYAYLGLVTVFVIPALIGWAVARTHRTHQAAMVMAYTASLLAYSVWWYCAHATLFRIPHLLEIQSARTCVALFSTIVGGFFPTPVSHPKKPATAYR